MKKVNYVLAKFRAKGYRICYKGTFKYVNFIVFQDSQANEDIIYLDNIKSLDTVPAETCACPQWDLKILLHQ